MINLGLGDVLLNAETGEIYTPNTNKLVKMGENSTQNSENITILGQKEDENDKNVQNSTEIVQNSQDLDPKGIITPQNEKVTKIEENGAKKGGEKDEDRN